MFGMQIASENKNTSLVQLKKNINKYLSKLNETRNNKQTTGNVLM